MATSETITRFVELVRKDYSNPYPFVAGYLGAMVDEKELLSEIAHMERNQANV